MDSDVTLIELLRSIVGEPVFSFSFANIGLMIEYIFACFLSLVIIVLLFRAIFYVLNLFCFERR